jgi:hypothetical protein
MPNGQQIVDAIAAVARKLGRAPTRSEFISLTGISEYYITRFFSTWHDALRAAGLQPRFLKVPVEDTELLKDWGDVARKLRAAPSRRAYRREGKYDLRTLERRFGRWSLIPRAFAGFAKDIPEWSDVVSLLPAPNEARGATRARAAAPTSSYQQHHALRKDLPSYGNPLDYQKMRHEPINEQGVVLLFGMLAEELGLIVEAVQNAFPDCEAKRRISPQRWERVRIEFEFESRNFRDHGHPPAGCDIIVCWRHNWQDCPPQLQVVELSAIIKSLPVSEA